MNLQILQKFSMRNCHCKARYILLTFAMEVLAYVTIIAKADIAIQKVRNASSLKLKQTVIKL